MRRPDARQAIPTLGIGAIFLVVFVYCVLVTAPNSWFAGPSHPDPDDVRYMQNTKVPLYVTQLATNGSKLVIPGLWSQVGYNRCSKLGCETVYATEAMGTPVSMQEFKRMSKDRPYFYIYPTQWDDGAPIHCDSRIRSCNVLYVMPQQGSGGQTYVIAFQPPPGFERRFDTALKNGAFVPAGEPRRTLDHDPLWARIVGLICGMLGTLLLFASWPRCRVVRA